MSICNSRSSATAPGPSRIKNDLNPQINLKRDRLAELPRGIPHKRSLTSSNEGLKSTEYCYEERLIPYIEP